MFFVGISAHIFIYLLVPALLIAYFYCKGIGGSPEIQDSLPATVIYVSALPSSRPERTYIFTQAFQQQTPSENPLLFHPVCLRRTDSSPKQSFYQSPFLSFLSLRAPPRV